MILDASVLLAVLFDEPGGEVLLEHPTTRMSAVNWAEVAQKAGDPEVASLAGDLGIEIVPFSKEHADAAAALHADTHRFGLSLPDRACLALAKCSGQPVLSADRSWQAVEGIDVRMVR